MASAQVVETSVTNNSPSQDSNHPDDLFQSRYVAPGFKPFSYEEVDVALLLGINCARVIKPREIIPGNDDDPYDKRTAHGWGVGGMVAPDTCNGEESVGVNRVAA